MMHYSWDYPAAKSKELIVQIGSRSRHLSLDEIGVLMPMKVKVGRRHYQRLSNAIVERGNPKDY